MKSGGFLSSYQVLNIIE